MTDANVNIHALDAAYAPFPTFSEWTRKTAVDDSRWERKKASLERLASGLSAKDLERARHVATRAAALDTGAIEGLYEVDRGFTFTVAFETAAWEAGLARKGENVRSLFEAQLHAYDYVLDLATKAEPISEAAIRALHVEVCAAQPTYRVVTSVGPQEQNLPKGQYKALPNHVRTRRGTDHSYAPVDVTPSEMSRFVVELRDNAFLNAHPIIQAAYAHYCLVVIHPFADGNGRVARALASAYTYRSVRMPIVILAERKNSYLDSLERADAGDYQEFVNFMMAQCLDTIGLVEESLLSATSPSPDDSLSTIGALYYTKGGYTHEQVDHAGIQLLELVQTSFREAAAKMANSKVTANIGYSGAHYNLDTGFRYPIGGGRALHLTLTSLAPVQTQSAKHYTLLLPNDATGADDVHLAGDPNDPADMFSARIDELLPSPSGMLHVRAKLFAERIINKALADLATQASRMMGRQR